MNVEWCAMSRITAMCKAMPARPRGPDEEVGEHAIERVKMVKEEGAGP